ncbi:MAG: hypothetical protein ACO1O1_07110 [Adhaeribacter sp.]
MALLRHNLNTVCRLVEPALEAREAFRQGLLSLLQQTRKWQDEDEAGRYLAGILQNTCLAPGYERPRQHSSPVCYAQTPGLRPGFEDMLLPDQLETARPAEDAPLPAAFRAGDAGWQELFTATHQSVSLILNGPAGHKPADPALAKRIADLVGGLFNLPAGKTEQPPKRSTP